MTHTLRVACLAVTAVAAVPSPVAAQLPWFNGLGVSAGGGSLRFDGQDQTLTPIRRDDDSAGAVAVGLELSLGSRRWALLLPELHYLAADLDVSGVSGALTLGSRTVTFEAERHTISVFAMLAAAQIAVVPNGRAWVRGGIGGGWITNQVTAEDQDITIQLDARSQSGVALSMAAGGSIWTKELTEGRRTSVDVEVHYLTVRHGEQWVSAPSVRVGWRFVLWPLE